MAESTSAKEFTITRVFEAPIGLVWEAWTNPEELSHWWHPRGFSTPRASVSVDLRVGGEYRYTMVDDASGDEYPTGGRYLEIEPTDRLSFTWGNPGDDGAPVITLSFRSLGDSTELVFALKTTQGIPGVYDGWQSALDVFEEYIEDAAGGDDS